MKNYLDPNKTHSPTFAYKSLNASYRLKEINDVIKANLVNKPLTFNYINATLESILTVLINITTIKDIKTKTPTNYYLKSKPKSIPKTHEDYLQLGRRQGWGTPYGTLGYYLHLSGDRRHYLSPSQIVTKCNDVFLNNLYVNGDSYLGINVKDWNSIVKYLQINIYSESIDEVQLYKSYNQLLTIINPFKELSDHLDSLSILIPEIVNWYLKNHYRNELPSQPSIPKGTNRYEAYKTLRDIAKVSLNIGVISLDNIIYRLFHLDTGGRLDRLYEKVIDIRANTLYNSNLDSGSIEERLTNRLINGISRSPKLSNTTLFQSFLLDYFPEAGGFNLLMVSIASNLVNRLYIATHPSYLIERAPIDNFHNGLINELLGSPSEEVRQYTSELNNRITKSMYLASYCLRKCNLKPLILLGNNLLKASSIKDKTKLEVTDIYD